MYNKVDFHQDLVRIKNENLESLPRNSQSEDDMALKDVALQFESIFLNMMLKQMRQAADAWNEDGLFSSHEQRFIRTLHDEALTEQLASQSHLGLAKMLVKQLSLQGNSLS